MNFEENEDNKTPSSNQEEITDNIFSEAFGDNRLDDDFIDVGEAWADEGSSNEVFAVDANGDLVKKAAAETEKTTEIAETYTQAATSMGFLVRQRSVRFQGGLDSDDPDYNLLSEDSLSTLKEFQFDVSPSTPSAAPEKGWLDDMEAEEELDDKDVIEEGEEGMGKSLLYTGAAGVAFYFLHFLLRKAFSWFANQAQNDAVGETTTDAVNEGADTSVQVKGTLGAATGHTSAGATSKGAVASTMQASFNASASASHSSSNLAGGFFLNNPSSAMSPAQYVLVPLSFFRLFI